MLLDYLESDHVLSVHFEDLVLGEQSVPGRRRVFADRSDLAVDVREPHVTAAVLVQTDRALERPEKKTRTTLQ